LEREMLLRGERRERGEGRRRTTVGSEGDEGSAGEVDSTDASRSLVRDLIIRSRNGKSYRTRQLAPASGDPRVLSNHPPTSTTSSDPSRSSLLPQQDESETDDESDTMYDPDRPLDDIPKRAHVPTLPPYVDARPTIKTYFKIYSPSRGGRMLSVYESAPDKFNFSQSWGWKSSTLMLDDGLGDDTVGGEEVLEGTAVATEPVIGNEKREKEGRLRFMVVIGNI
jgi:hypothetical protein